MQLAALCASLAPALLVDCTGDLEPLLAGTGVDVTPELDRAGSDGAVLVAHVPAVATDLAGVLDEVAGLVADGAPLVLALGTDAADLDVDVLTDAVTNHELAVATATSLDHVTMPTGLVLETGATDASRTRLLELAAERLRDRAEAAEAAAAAAATSTDELERRGERIAALTSEVDELRERLDAANAERSLTVKARDKRITRLQRRVRDLERSASYRMGHFVVRAAKDPALLLQLPGKLARMIRRRLLG